MESISEVKQNLTLILLYLNSWTEKKYPSIKRSWKRYDFDDLDNLIEQEFIDGKYSTTSVCFSKKGIEETKRLLKEYGILPELSLEEEKPDPKAARISRRRQKSPE